MAAPAVVAASAEASVVARPERLASELTEMEVSALRPSARVMEVAALAAPLTAPAAAEEPKLTEPAISPMPPMERAPRSAPWMVPALEPESA